MVSVAEGLNSCGGISKSWYLEDVAICATCSLDNSAEVFGVAGVAGLDRFLEDIFEAGGVCGCVSFGLLTGVSGGWSPVPVIWPRAVCRRVETILDVTVTVCKREREMAVAGMFKL